MLFILETKTASHSFDDIVANRSWEIRLRRRCETANNIIRDYSLRKSDEALSKLQNYRKIPTYTLTAFCKAILVSIML